MLTSMPPTSPSQSSSSYSISVFVSEDEVSSGWGDLNERWQALRGSPPPQRRRLASPPPSSPGNLAAPLVLDEDGRPVIPPPPEPMPMPTGVFFL